MADPKWEKHLPPVYKILVEGVRVSGTLLNYLVQDGLLTLAERSQVDNVQPNTEEKKAHEMVELLRKKPPGSFDTFCLVLEKVNYEQLADALRTTTKHNQSSGQSAATTARDPAGKLTGDDLLDRHVTQQQIIKVSSAVKDKWDDIGRNLGFKRAELEEYKEYKMSSRLFNILSDWVRAKYHPTVGALSDACEKAGVGGEVNRILGISGK
jgi:hypothetical protein